MTFDLENDNEASTVRRKKLYGKFVFAVARHT